MYKMISGKFDPLDGSIDIVCSGIYEYSLEDVDLYICGDVWVSDPDSKNDGSEIIHEFIKEPTTFTERVKGMYIALIYCKAKREVYVFHDRNTSPLPFYYCCTGGKIYFGTSLKQILAKAPIHRELNEDVVRSFIANGTVLGPQTLLKNVFKLGPFSALRMSKEGSTQFEVSYSIRKYSEDEAKALWEPTLEKIIDSYLDENKNAQEICQTLSSGFDSNYILHVINKLRDPHKKLHAFSLGGQKGTNEVLKVKENIKCFDNISLSMRVIDHSCLQKYPDIVWRLEGLMYERGILLRHELGELLSSSGVTSIIGGDGMDETSLQEYYEVNREMTNNINMGLYPEKPAYLMFAYLYIKKDGVMDNSYGVTQFFPYLDNRFADIIYSTTRLNGETKIYHKEVCKNTFYPEIFNRASTIGGATQGQALFDTYRQLRTFYREVEHTDIFKRYAKRIGNTSEESQLQHAKSIIRSILSSIKHGRNNVIPLIFKHEESRIQYYLKILYVDLFEKLFVSGEYDALLCENGISITLSDIYSKA